MTDNSERKAQILELADIQGTLLRQRPWPYTGAYFLLRIDDAADGRKMVRQLAPQVASAERWWDPPNRAWFSVALSHAGLRALGVPQASLDSFPPEFREGMAARAARLGDVGESNPEHWDPPLGTSDVHVALSVFAPDDAGLQSVLDGAREALNGLPGVSVIYRLDAHQLPTGRTHLGFVDGIGEPDIEGAGVASILQTQAGGDHYGYLPGFGPTIKAGEFLLGYVNELGRVGPMPQPDILGRNGTYVAFRKLHMRVAAFRRYLKDNASSPEEEELLAAKMVGRWRSGAPLVLAPEHDDPDLAADPQRANDFAYRQEDPRGLRCPLGSHIRRMNPRDDLSDTFVDVKLHRALRRGATYGPMLPEGQLEDDGADRGIVFIFMGTDLVRQFEFIKTQWANDGDFVGLGTEKDPVIGDNDATGTFTIPRQPIRRRLRELPRFAVTKGGEYLFMPGIRALNWLAELDA
ncbi:Dyp-type peroxidase [Nonomuraea africana]|uniref:Dyp-type peroxidase family n=1 Tax=Nonomuraea africana TaxID=46171 RepID=A0ABR9KDH0_9ACTN|nr:Dyp-type peroxidase [Nonomuraea africana]MBE1560045.1 Dyp-type peroxidase family [Nonomuraea africana]